MNPDADDLPGLAAGEDGNGPLTDSFQKTLALAFKEHNAGRDREAEALCRVLMQICPRDAQLVFLLGMILHKTGRDEEAVKWLSRAAEYQSQSARIFSGLGCAYQSLKDHARAASSFARSLALEPKSTSTCYNLGNSCYRLGQIERAATLFRQAVGMDPRDSASWNNLGKCLKELNRLEESIGAYNRALEVASDYSLAHYGRAITLLTAGRLKEGFQEYEWRWHTVTPRHFPQPVWNGDPAPGQTLFLHAEQGFGDAIHMVRFVPEARKRVARVILECRPELHTLFQCSKCADVVIPHGAPIPPFDCFISLISLPCVLGTTLDTIPHRTPYLQAPSEAGSLPKAPGRLKVGLAWAGNPEHHQDAARSIRLKELAPILQVPGVAFYNLQQPVPAGDQAGLRSLSDVIHSGPKFADFLETASAISGLDLVITVDTAVAHLAGALGKPVWTFIQYSPDWRWFLNRADTPWYPTMQLFRQAEPDRWEPPIIRAAEALRRLSQDRSARI
jgi:tetratricopeptide (TPR) repeat protein